MFPSWRVAANTALFAVEYALAKLWMHYGYRPDYLIGHSMGEFAAAAVAGVFSLRDGLFLTKERGRLMQFSTPEGRMMTLFAGAEKTAEMLRPYGEKIVIGAYNSPEHTVVSGNAEAIEDLARECDHQGPL